MFMKNAISNRADSPIWRYLLLHLLLAALVGVLLLFHFVTRRFAGSIIICPMHDLLHLYCPFCGGTRAILSILTLRPLAALRYNPFVSIGLLVFAFFDIRALIRLIRKREAPLSIPKWIFPTAIAAGIVYTVLRNLLVIAFGIDPVGDLLPYYHP
jgi:hypothetical protein